MNIGVVLLSLFLCGPLVCSHAVAQIERTSPNCVSVCVSPIVARQRVGENVTATMNTHATVEELSDASFFYAVRVVSKESRRLVLLRTSCIHCHV
jgi:hypothetical protein